MAAVKCYASGYIFCQTQITITGEDGELKSIMSAPINELGPSTSSVTQEIQSGIPGVELSLGSKLNALLARKDGEVKYTLVFSVTERSGDDSETMRDDFMQLSTKTFLLNGDFVVDHPIDHEFEGGVIRIIFSKYRLVDNNRIRAIAKERGLNQSGDDNEE